MTIDSDLPPLTQLPEKKFELERWLHVATSDLCEDAKVRVRKEIESHFNAAYEEMQREGMIDAAARAWALTALGDPGKARRRYNKLYLTEQDRMTLNYLIGLRSHKLLAVPAIFFGMLALYIFYNFSVAFSPDMSGVVYFALANILIFQLAFSAFFGKRWPRLAVTGWMVCLPACVGIFAMNLYRFFTHRPSENFSPKVSNWIIGITISATTLVFAIVIAQRVAIYWSIVRKLRDEQNVQAAFSNTTRSS